MVATRLARGVAGILLCGYLVSGSCGATTQVASPTPAATGAAMPAQEIVAGLIAQGLPLEQRTRYTAALDNRIGKPGQYIDRLSFRDLRLDGPGVFVDQSGNSTGQVWVFANERDAVRYSQDLRGPSPDGNPTMYVFQRKYVVLALDRRLSIEQADAYSQALDNVVP